MATRKKYIKETDGFFLTGTTLTSMSAPLETWYSGRWINPSLFNLSLGGYLNQKKRRSKSRTTLDSGFISWGEKEVGIERC